MQIYLIRHPQSEICTDPEKLKNAVFSSDLAAITEIGERQIAITSEELSAKIKPDNKVIILCAPNHRTVQAANILAEGLNYRSAIRAEEFLSEIGQGPIGELNDEQIKLLRAVKPELAEQQEIARKQLKQAGFDHYNSAFPYDRKPVEIEKSIREPLLDYLENERATGTDVVVIVGNAGNMLLIEKILAGHDVKWFNDKFAQQNRPPRASITLLRSKNGWVTEAGFYDLGLIFAGEQSARLIAAGLGNGKK